MLEISVVIPVYNASKTIVGVLNSVLNQSLEVKEIIIINDNSNDNTFAILKECVSSYASNNIFLINLTENMGVSYCRNLGWDKASGDYVAFLDADDYWNEFKIEIMVNIINKYGSLSLLGHSYTEDYIDVSRKYFYNERLLTKINFFQMLLFNRFQTSCVIVNNCILERFNEKITHSEDYDLFLRLSAQDQIIVYYREELTCLGRPQLSQGGLSEKKLSMRIGEMKAYKSGLKIKKMNFFIPVLIIYSFLKSLFKLHK